MWADELEEQAAELKRRFNDDFCVEERSFSALGLDGQKRQIDSLTSNVGRLDDARRDHRGPLLDLSPVAARAVEILAAQKT